MVVVMFKCSRLSSAPADSQTEPNENKSSENELAPNQGAYNVARPPSLSYISDVDDLGSTGVVFQFRRSIKSDNTEIEARRRSALDKGFMRFGRAGNMLRFGRSPDSGSDIVPSKPRKNDKNYLRFGRGRPDRDGFMRFGRNNIDDSDMEDYNDASERDEFIDRPVVRSPDNNRYDEHGNKILRLGRSSSESVSNENYEVPPELQPSSENTDGRNGNKKSADRNMLRFGRGNMLRFGRGNVMRFGKRANMLRFGRAHYFKTPDEILDNRQIRGGTNDRNLIRLGRGGNLIRFGRNEKNLMRFGKRSGDRPQSVSSSTKIYCEDDNCLLQENDKQITEAEAANNDHLQHLFGNDPLKQGYGEYVIEK